MYDNQGRHAQTIVERESEWDPQQQAWMLALQVWRAGQCKRCGGDLEETTNPAHSLDNPRGTHVYRRTALKRCHRCTALMESERKHTETRPGHAAPQHPAAVMHYVELVPRGTPSAESAARRPRKQQPPRG